MASAYLAVLKEVLPVSRSLVICADRLGLTGTGGGGTVVWGGSSVKRARCRVLRASSSAVRARVAWEGWVVVMALDLGSMWRGRRVKVSSSAMVAGEKSFGVCLMRVVFLVYCLSWANAGLLLFVVLVEFLWCGADQI